MNIKTIAVFCGSHDGKQEAYVQAARSTGRTIAEAGLGLVYGGGKVGLMGAVADAALAAGGKVIGVMPRALVAREIAHQGLSELREVASMHERKHCIAEIADAFVALPGGVGTFEEIFEQWAWAQLGIHEKPPGLLNVHGYFDPLLAMITRMVEQDFMDARFAEMLLVDTEPLRLLQRFHAYQPPAKRWSTPSVGELRP